MIKRKEIIRVFNSENIVAVDEIEKTAISEIEEGVKNIFA